MIFFDRVIDYMDYIGDAFPEIDKPIIQVQFNGPEYICLVTSFENFQKYHDRYLEYLDKSTNFVQKQVDGN